MCASAEQFLHELVKRALKVSETDKKRAIDVEHILQALESIGGAHLCDEVRNAAVVEIHETEGRTSQKKAKRVKLSAEELTALAKEQDALLEASRKSAIGH